MHILRRIELALTVGLTIPATPSQIFGFEKRRLAACRIESTGPF
jgi:hypothetical protein